MKEITERNRKETIKQVLELSNLPAEEIAKKLNIRIAEVRNIISPHKTNLAPTIENAIDILENQAKKEIEQLPNADFEAQLILKDFISYFIENQQSEVTLSSNDFVERLMNLHEQPKLSLSNITGLDNNRINAIARLAIADYLRTECEKQDLEN
ncbi:hypothetical protein [Vibrio vulnificus]|uniref:hypothetical protein n=1 Tax=Vibrio vulnificus TaxID=672 RepID=UPI0032428080